jgi:quercetin dioxygenase-like cupin family protein
MSEKKKPIPSYNWKTIPTREMRPGIIHSDFRGNNVVVGRSLLYPGMQSKPHKHVYEQIFMILEGRVKLHIEDQVIDCPAGTVLRIPPNAMHWAEGPEEGVAVNLDVWTPYREDYGEYTSYQTDEFDLSEKPAA